MRSSRATGYVTVAERPLDPALFPGAPAENLVPGSLVFTGTPGPVDLRHLSQWWAWTPGACWRRPYGAGSGVADLGDHPVVHVAHEDAVAYATWIGAELPSEAQWERAARGGLDGAEFTWGDDPRPGGRLMANHWNGDFPWRNTLADGFARTSPVGSFPPNGYGLSDMAGNVWEWTADWYADRHPEPTDDPCCAPVNPRGADPGGEPRSRPTAVRHPAQGHQGRLAPVRRLVLPALPAGRPHDRRWSTPARATSASGAPDERRTRHDRRRPARLVA